MSEWRTAHLADGTSSTTTAHARVAEFVEYVDRGDMVRAEAVLALARATIAPSAVVDLVLVPALQRLGDRCDTGRITARAANDATAIVAAMVDTLGSRDPVAGRALGRVAIACAPGEWHDLP